MGERLHGPGEHQALLSVMYKSLLIASAMDILHCSVRDYCLTPIFLTSPAPKIYHQTPPGTNCATPYSPKSVVLKSALARSSALVLSNYSGTAST